MPANPQNLPAKIPKPTLKNPEIDLQVAAGAAQQLQPSARADKKLPSAAITRLQ